MMPQLEMGYSGPVGNCTVTASWNDPVYRPFEQYGVNTGVTMETDAVQVQVVTTEAGMITGSFTADFNAGSQNTDAAYRGTIQGKFQCGIVRSDDEADEKLPEDLSACLPTDFFVGAARGGADAAMIATAIADAAASAGSPGGGGAPGDDAVAGGGAAQGSVLDDKPCSVPKDRALFERWFDKEFVSQGVFSAEDLANMRNAFWETWPLTEQYICASGMAP
jgi:hypothetical protein